MNKIPYSIGFHISKTLCCVPYYDGILFNPGDKTQCKDHNRWAPKNGEDWNHVFPRKFWQQCFTYSRHSDMSIRIDENSVLCHRHYMETFNVNCDKKCKVCTSNDGSKWGMPFDKLATFNSILEKKQLGNLLTSPRDWICGSCIDNINQPHIKLKFHEDSNDLTFIKDNVKRAEAEISTKDMCSEEI